MTAKISRPATVMTVTFALLLGAACAKTKDATPDTTKVVPVAAATAPSLNSADTHKFGAVHHYQLEDTANAPITVDVQTADNAIIVNRNSPPAVDTILGKIVNTGPAKEKRYRFKPQTEAEYFVYAQAAPAGGWYITEKKTGSTEKPFAHGIFAVCDSTPHQPSAADVGFKWCARFGPKPAGKKAAMLKKPATVKSMGMFSSGLFGHLYERVMALFQNDSSFRPGDGGDDPGWVSCTDGCCTMGNATFNNT